MLEKDGRISARYHYDEFGVVLDAKKFDINWAGPDNLFGYTGLGYDYYSDLTYARARYYKPELGRFISEDTYKGDIWNALSQNQYTYVGNNPINFVDPSGHFMQYDENLFPALSLQQRNKILQYQEKWKKAKESNDIKEMQNAHDSALYIRSQILYEVERYNYSTGKKEILNSPFFNRMQITNNGIVADWYFKAEASASFIMNVGTELKIQGNSLSIAINYGTDGSIGGQFSITSGAAIHNSGSEINESLSTGTSLGFGLVTESKFQIDPTDNDWELMLGAGYGLAAKLTPGLPIDAGVNGQWQFTITFMAAPSYPMTYSEWMRHLSN
ncbi:RHS repeat-associated core domain-containing protein [Marinicrinis lubricantis]|uniref:RHS repeat-associated core domain-containing protein n=1 Tax=Marinicrinis lubricantis TaxID=2086470 RepID=A0ABW1IKM5_9BACL